jgi:NAD+ diphosphatase
MRSTDPAEVFRYCPRCGSGDFSLVTDRSFQCSHCGFHYFINASSAVAALILNAKGELLFTRRAVNPHKGKLDLPGGFIDPGESAEQALARELKEELSLEIRSLEYVASAPNEYIYSGFTVFTLDMAFRVIPHSLTGFIPKDDISGYEWILPTEVDFAELPARSMQYFVKRMIRNCNP